MSVDYFQSTISRFRMGTASVNGLALFVGGIVSCPDLTASNTVDIYDSTIGLMIPGSPISIPRGDVACAATGDLAVCAGGFNGTTYYSTVDIFNSTSREWISTSLSLNVTISGLAASGVGNEILFGLGNSGYQMLVWTFDQLSNSISRPYSLPLTPGFPQGAATTVANRWVVFAGNQSVYIYDSQKSTWWDTTNLALSSPRNYATATSVGNYAFIGFDSSSNSNDIDIISFESNSYRCPISLPVQ
jgi:hypothetical protein